MILDQQLMFSDAQSLTGSAVSSNVIDLGAYDLTSTGGAKGRGRNLGAGDNTYIGFVFSAFGGTTPTINVAVQASVDTNFSTFTAGTVLVANPYTIVTTKTINLGATVINRLFLIDITPMVPMLISNVTGGATGGPPRAFRLNYTMAGTSPTATVTAFMILDAEILPVTTQNVEWA